MLPRPLLLAALAAAIAPAAAHAASETLGKTTADVRVVGGDRAAGFAFLTTGPGAAHRVRDDLGAKPGQGREGRRVSLAYFAQLSDFQLADEESPARVEMTDQVNSFFGSAWRPQEAMAPHVVDASIRQVNSHLKSPHGSGAPLAFTILTGDNADNQHTNETEWVARLLEGGRIDPNSGSPDPAAYADCAPGAPGPEEAALYTGVQDYDDYYESTAFYDPDLPAGQYEGWPAWPGLMDRAQQPFDTPGLSVPSYVAVGNHDYLVQGNEDAIGPYDSVAQSCRKPLVPSLNFGNPADILAASLLTTDPSRTIDVPPDPKRALISKPEYRRLFDTGRQADAHGFAFIDPAEAAASRNAATYYDFSPVKGLRMIALDTVSDGGVAGPSADGNVDDPQFRWLENELKAATAADELVILYSHHAPVSLTADIPDELAQSCQTPDQPENDPNPGCDLDPRPSTPLHLGEDMVGLLHQYPHVIAWIAGHSHVNDVAAYLRPQPVPAQGGSAPPGGGFWVVRTSAEADWPHQDRLLELMDNRDGTLSLIGTLIDNASPLGVPTPGTPAAGFDKDQLASIARTLGYNDPQAGGGSGEGGPEDHNIELLIPDPRRAPGTVSASKPRLRVTVRPRRVRAGRRVRYSFRVTANGRPVRRARVHFAGRTVRTNSRGRARMTVRIVRAGRRPVRATRAGHTAGRTSVRVLRRR